MGSEDSLGTNGPTHGLRQFVNMFIFISFTQTLGIRLVVEYISI